MNKTIKNVLIISSVAVAFIIGACILLSVLWYVAFAFPQPKEIETYNSPSGEYSLVFEQMGDPEWPFGPTEVRLTLEKRDEIIELVTTQLFNDGANASKGNVVSVSWSDDAVSVVLKASEMKDKEIIIAYDNN